MLKKYYNYELLKFYHQMETSHVHDCVCVCVCVYIYWPISLVDRIFINGLGDQVSIPGQVIPKTKIMVIDTSLLNTLHYKVYIKSRVEHSQKRSSTLPYTSV